MKEWKQLLEDYGRFLALEDQIPCLEQAVAETTASVRSQKTDVDYLKLDVINWDNPGFFQRLLNNVPEKQEQARKAYNQAQMEYAQMLQKQESVQCQLEEARQEMLALAGNREAYLQRAQSLSPEEKALLPELARDAFAPGAIAAAGRCIGALENARPWMQADARYRGVSRANRKLEFLAEAQKHARRLSWFLEQMPPETVTIGAYVKYPEGYVTGVTSEYRQLDRLNLAIEQVQNIQQQLKSRFKESK